jgi:hypothetical protein
MKKNVLVVAIILLLIISGCTQEAVQEDNPENTGTNQTNPSEQSDPIEDESGKDLNVVVLASVLNVRDQADLSGEVIGSVNEGDALVITDTKIDDSGFPWYNILIDDSEGYVAGWYCIDKNDYDEMLGRAHLISAYDGHFDNSNIIADENKDAIIKNMGNANSQSYFMGGTALEYDNYTFLLYGSGVDGRSEGDIAGIFYHGTDTRYGVQGGVDMEQIKEVLGKPNREEVISTEEESFYSFGTVLLTYYTGSYKVTFISDNEEKLSRIELSELVR